MGGTRWSDAFYHQRAKQLRTSGRSAFEHDEDIRLQRTAAAVHPLMDPSQMKGAVRESRDSDKHPVSLPIAVMFDVTGSMRRVPHIVQQNLCTLLGLCLEGGYVTDPAILIGGVGDATCDLAPLQVGQFESGNEIDEDLSRLYLEGGGGGQKSESYELALYFLARKTAHDAWEKRGKRGYAFLIGDELPYREVSREAVKRVFGDKIRKNIPTEKIIEEAQQRYDIYYILPNMTAHYDDPEILSVWRSLLGQNVLRLEDPGGVSELIASTIGLGEETVCWADLQSNLAKAGAQPDIAKAVAAALQR